MNKDMLQDALAAEKRKTKILSVVLAIVACLLVGMTVFAFSSFDVTSDESTEISYEADVGNGDNATVTQTNETAEKDYTVYIICGTIIICIALLVFGVCWYGKSKNDYKKNQENPHTQA